MEGQTDLGGAGPAAEEGGLGRRLHGTLLFVGRSIRHPHQVCSITPSSPGVGRAMARAIAARPAAAVVELGGGTGPVTRELLASGVDPACLGTVELDRELAAHLRAHFPLIEVLNIPAQSLSDLWAREGRDKVGAVVSTLPLRIFDAAAVDAVLAAVFAIMEPGGMFVQFTYRFVSPVDDDTVARFGLVARRSEIVWRNVPPAAIWVYSRAGGAREAVVERDPIVLNRTAAPDR
jgi:phosphatidylethanolamine/phosphatidyl-N-methylethanolamine N-methyltransferase